MFKYINLTKMNIRHFQCSLLIFHQWKAETKRSVVIPWSIAHGRFESCLILSLFYELFLGTVLLLTFAFLTDSPGCNFLSCSTV